MPTTTDDARSESTPWWKRTFLLGWGDIGALAVALAAVVAVGTAIGWLLFRLWTDGNPLIEADEAVTDWFVDARTDDRNTLASVGAHLSDTLVKVIVTAIVAGIMLWVWRRWREVLLVVLSLTFEACAYVAISFLVGRQRPEEQLIESPVNTTFPSGHVAAATVYGAFAIIVFWHTRATWARSLAVGLTALVAVIVAVARVYQGMHYLTDVIAGIVLGVVSLVICVRVIGAPPDAESAPLGGRRADDEAASPAR